jgi:hypothetical protein
MRVKHGNVDSLNLLSEAMEAIFIYYQGYTIEDVKTKSVFIPKVWSIAFGKSLSKNIIEAKIIHTYLGLKIPLKTFAVTPKSQTVEFAGLHGYNERSEHLMRHLQELKSQLQYARVTRIDIAIDFKDKIPKSIVKVLSKHRKPFKWKNTTYYKTAKEKRTNRVMDIKIYDKALHANLDYELNRLEFCFKSGYLKKLLLKDVKSVYAKMEKSIKKATGLNVKINHILDLKK